MALLEGSSVRMLEADGTCCALCQILLQSTGLSPGEG